VESTFRFDRNCFFCGTEVNFEYNRKKSQDAFRVTMLETKDSGGSAVGRQDGRAFWLSTDSYFLLGLNVLI